MHILAALTLLLLSPLEANAYIDPGSGMLIIQSVIAFIGAAAFFLKNPIKNSVALLKRLFSRGKK